MASCLATEACYLRILILGIVRVSQAEVTDACTASKVKDNLGIGSLARAVVVVILTVDVTVSIDQHELRLESCTPARV